MTNYFLFIEKTNNLILTVFPGNHLQRHLNEKATAKKSNKQHKNLNNSNKLHIT